MLLVGNRFHASFYWIECKQSVYLLHSIICVNRSLADSSNCETQAPVLRCHVALAVLEMSVPLSSLQVCAGLFNWAKPRPKSAPQPCLAAPRAKRFERHSIDVRTARFWTAWVLAMAAQRTFLHILFQFLQRPAEEEGTQNVRPTIATNPDKTSGCSQCNMSTHLAYRRRHHLEERGWHCLTTPQ